MDISIIIPVYNVEKYVLSCLESVDRQIFKGKMECIIVDDCGSDMSMTIVNAFVENNEKNIFKIIHHNQNKGLSAARNTGVKEAKGHYLFFLDSDDEITPTCIEDLWNLVVKYPNVDLVQGSYIEKPSYICKQYQFQEYSNDTILVKSTLLNYDINPITAQNRLVRRDIVVRNQLFFKEGIIHEDNHWTFFLAKYVETMAVCSIPTYLHRYNPNSITHNRNISKEISSYKVIIEEFCCNIDELLIGCQKELILNTLIQIRHSKLYVNEKEWNYLILQFTKQCSFLEVFFLKLYFIINNVRLKNKILHLLIRLFKLKEI